MFKLVISHNPVFPSRILTHFQLFLLRLLRKVWIIYSGEFLLIVTAFQSILLYLSLCLYKFPASLPSLLVSTPSLSSSLRARLVPKSGASYTENFLNSHTHFRFSSMCVVHHTSPGQSNSKHLMFSFRFFLYFMRLLLLYFIRSSLCSSFLSVTNACFCASVHTVMKQNYANLCNYNGALKRHLCSFGVVPVSCCKLAVPVSMSTHAGQAYSSLF